MHNIPLFKVFMPESVLEPISQTIMSGMLTQGSKVEEFEKKLGDFFGYQSLVTTNSATSAIHLALRLIGVGPGDEVISTPLTCTATNWPIILSGADIVWSDIELDTCNIDPKEVEKNITSKTKAIMAVHWGGYPCDLAALADIAYRHGLPIIEDCAHAFGSKFKDRKIGSNGNYCSFSFQAIKVA
jgi:dTDP-4-amino-4,6-dideoxygalactose transaminase